MELSPKEYGLTSRIKLKEIAPNHIGIVKLVKSRIIRKDALKIIEIAKNITSIKPEYRVSLICYKNICSKSIELLKENDIRIQFDYLNVPD